MKFKVITKLAILLCALMTAASPSVSEIGDKFDRVYAYAHNEALLQVHLQDNFFYLDRMDDDAIKLIQEKAERASEEILFEVANDPDLLSELSESYQMAKADAEGFGRRQIASHVIYDHDLSKKASEKSLLEEVASEAIKEGEIPTGFLQRLAVRAVYQPYELADCLTEDTESLHPFDAIPLESSPCQQKMIEQFKDSRKRRSA